MWNNEAGEFVRKDTKFRGQIRADGSTPFQPEAGRYHLYVSYACPWAHRTLIVRSLRGLTDLISVSVVDPIWNENGWYFSGVDGSTADEVNGKRDLIDIYRQVDPSFTEDETVPILWDRKSRTIVNNESLQIIRMFDLEFAGFGRREVNLYPADHARRIDEAIALLYPNVNNGVYRTGFAVTQRAYERALKTLFEALDHWESVLGKSRYACGDVLTEADVCFFTTLIRFDIVYFGHFKCNLRQIREYPNLWNYLKDLYQTPGVAETCRLDHMKRHYYGSHQAINPTGIIPSGPLIDFNEPHDRDRLGRRALGRR